MKWWLPPLLFLYLVTLINAGRYDPPPAGSIVVQEGDMLQWNTRSSSSAPLSSAVRNGKWKNGVVPFFLHSSLSTSDKNLVIGAMNEIKDKTCVTFRAVRDDDDDFLLIVKPDEGVCNSFVGRTGGQQILNLGDGCYSRGTILHELMHALAFIHEQNRADRDQYVDIQWSNIEPKARSNFMKYKANSLTLMDTPYTYESIMHYKEFDFSINKRMPTIIPKRKASNIGGGDKLSPIDALRINKYYGCATTTAPTTTNNNKEIKWSSGDFNMYWSYACDFRGDGVTDIERIPTNAAQCLEKCFLSSRCTHFTWNPAGICILKVWSSTPILRPYCITNDVICGVKGSNSKAAWRRVNDNPAIFWKEDCDFTFGDISHQHNTKKEQCETICYNNPPCNAFTWFNGKCLLKKLDSRSASWIKYPGAICGRINRHGDANHNSLGERLPPVMCK